MNLSTFWKRPSRIILYMKSGNVIPLTGVKSFRVQTSTVTGKITKLEWEFKAGHQHILDIQADEIEAIIQKR